MSAVLHVEVTLPRESGASVASQVPSATGFAAVHKFLTWLVSLLWSIEVSGGRVRVEVEESTPKAATGTVTLTQASLTAGDAVVISYGGVVAKLVAVAGAANAALGQWSIDTSSTAAATSLALAINTFAELRGVVSATSSTGVVTITAATGGVQGNTIRLQEVDASGGIALSGALLTGGVSQGALQSVDVTFTGIGTANDTVTIGGHVITLVASAANEDQCTIGGSAAATATNLIAVINANSKLRGIVVASSGGSAVVRLTLQMTGRIGRLITLAKNSTAISALPAANFLASTTEAWKKDAVTFAVGLPQ